MILSCYLECSCAWKKKMLQKFVLEFEQLLYDVCEVFRCLDRTCKVWEVQKFGFQNSRVEVLWTVMAFVNMIFWGFINKMFDFSLYFSDLLLLQMLLLFIGKRFVNKRIWFINHGVMARLDYKYQVMSWSQDEVPKLLV